MKTRPSSLLARLAISALLFYSRKGGGSRFGVECNFTPSCSVYARTALERFGLRQGTPMILARLRRCNDPNCLHPIPDPIPELPNVGLHQG